MLNSISYFRSISLPKCNNIDFLFFSLYFLGVFVALIAGCWRKPCVGVKYWNCGEALKFRLFVTL